MADMQINGVALKPTTKSIGDKKVKPIPGLIPELGLLVHWKIVFSNRSPSFSKLFPGDAFRSLSFTSFTWTLQMNVQAFPGFVIKVQASPSLSKVQGKAKAGNPRISNII